MMSSQLPSNDLFTNPEGPCCLGAGNEGCLGCLKEERALREISAGLYRPMTQAERDFCKREIAAVEGYSESDADGTDADVARTVLHAWTDYCRDKGAL